MIGPVACVIPAYEAADTLAGVVSGLRAAIPATRVIVVDDGSGDGTAGVARDVADCTVSLGRNRGKGAALRAGFAAALAGGATAIVTIDADGQHDPARAPAIVDALSGADIVIGARRRRGTPMPWPRRLTNTLSSVAVSACAGQRLADVQSGYRALRSSVLARIAPVGDRYEYETDFLIQAARAGLTIASVAVPTLYTRGGTSHFRPVRDTVAVVQTIWRRRSLAWS